MLKKLFLSAVLMTSGVSALSAASAGNFDPSNGQFRVIGEYLYWMPSVDDTYFVIEADATSTFPTGTRRNNDFNFNSGYRVGGAYLFCDCNRELLVRYTNLNFTQRKTVTGDFLWATQGRADFASGFENYAGTASSQLKFLYQNIDAVFAQQLYDCCGLDFAVEFGLEAVELKLNESYTYAVTGADIGTIDQHSKTTGIGPKVGFAVGYELFTGDCNCPGTLSLNICTAGSLLAADTKTSATNATTGGGTLLDVSDKKSWRVIPALHARVGLNYDMNFGCGDASLEVGYEFTSFLRGLSRTAYPDDVADSLSYNNFYNFDMQGLYVSGSFTF